MAENEPVWPPLLLVGCGKMGGAMLASWLRDGLAPSVVLKPSPLALPPPHRAVATIGDVPASFRPRVIVAAVKPQVADAVLPPVCARFPGVTVLSIMAGRRCESLSAACGGAPVIRAMPNTPAALGHGISGLFAPAAITDADRMLAAALLRSVGEVEALGREDDIDALSAVSGSGPAYVFLLAEVMERAGVAAGLDAAVARRLARATVSGAGRLLEADRSDAPALRAAVTSRGGTTEQALAVLMAEDAWPALMDRAVAAAVARARALAA